MNKIQVLKPKYNVEECLDEIRECLEIGWTGMGYKTIELENKWNDYTGHQFSHFLNSATAGLHLSLEVFKKQYGWNDGDEVITTPLTFVSTNHAILYSQLTPVFADVDDSLNLCSESVLKRITSKTKAIIFVGIGGNSANYKSIAKIAEDHGIKIILDAAHMGGARENGEIVGLNAHSTVYSYQAVKNLSTADSGMVCFKNEEADKIARELSWLGINKDTFSRSSIQGDYKWDYEVNSLGFKYHGNSVIAAIGLVQLKYLDENNAYRRRLAELYRSELNSSIRTIIHYNEQESSRHLFQLIHENRDDVIQKLAKNDIFCGVHYKNNGEYTIFKPYYKSCPKAEELSSKLLSLPLHLNLDEADVYKVSLHMNS